MTAGLPDPTTPADVIVGWSCFQNRCGGGSIVRLHRVGCRFCDVDLDDLRQWLRSADRTLATDDDRATPAQRRRAAR